MKNEPRIFRKKVQVPKKAQEEDRKGEEDFFPASQLERSEDLHSPGKNRDGLTEKGKQSMNTVIKYIHEEHQFDVVKHGYAEWRMTASETIEGARYSEAHLRVDNRQGEAARIRVHLREPGKEAEQDFVEWRTPSEAFQFTAIDLLFVPPREPSFLELRHETMKFLDMYRKER